MAYIGKTPVIGNFVKLDAISVVNGQASYTMQNGGSNFTEYETVNQFLVSLNGVLQSPTDSFTVSGSTITFASNLVTGDVIDFVMVLGNTLDVGTVSDNTVSLAKLTATGTKDATTFLRGDNTFAEAGGGIEEYDQWRVTATIGFTGNGTTDITTNLERNDTAGFSKIGTGMTESSGVFTFPSTGIYEIYAFGNFYSSSNIGYCRIGINTTQDNGSNYTLQSSANVHVHTNYYNLATNNFVFDVTNTSTHKVKFDIRHGNDGNLEGNSNSNVSWFSFKKLGDT
jgi:hypothetical protein